MHVFIVISKEINIVEKLFNTFCFINVQLTCLYFNKYTCLNTVYINILYFLVKFINHKKYNKA